jgi:hypothetical protein
MGVQPNVILLLLLLLLFLFLIIIIIIIIIIVITTMEVLAPAQSSRPHRGRVEGGCG